MISANKLYKESKSQLSFKDWLKETQQKGILQDHEKMYNMIESEGENDEDDEDDDLPTTSKKPSKSTTQTAKTKLGMVNLLGFVGLAVLIYGLSRTSAE
jgi:N-acetylmuramoyl-L-alanine amidase CwlA